MSSITVKDIENKDVKEIEFLPGIKVDKINPALVQQSVIRRLASERKGTASTKDRSQVNFSTVKLYRQKGTGRARAGSRKSPVRVGGGTIFGPKPRDYSYSIPKKANKKAISSVIFEKYRNGDVLVLEDLKLEEIKTKVLKKILSGLGIDSHSLILLGEKDEILKKSARNLPDVSVMNIQNINSYDLLKHKKLIIKEKDLAFLEEALV